MRAKRPSARLRNSATPCANLFSAPAARSARTLKTAALSSDSCQSVYLGHLLARQLPLHGLDVLFDLFGSRGSRNHACDRGPACEPAEGELQQRVAPRLGEFLEPFHDRPVRL